MGPLEKIVDMLPKMGPLQNFEGCEGGRGPVTRVEAIINSMTNQERREHNVIDGKRRKKRHRQGERHHRAGREYGPQAVSANATMMKQYGSMAARAKLKGLGKLSGLS